LGKETFEDVIVLRVEQRQHDGSGAEGNG